MQVQYLYVSQTAKYNVCMSCTSDPKLTLQWDVHIFDDQSEFIQEIVGLKFSDRAYS